MQTEIILIQLEFIKYRNYLSMKQLAFLIAKC
jgi:hypothetical protein